MMVLSVIVFLISIPFCLAAALATQVPFVVPPVIPLEEHVPPSPATQVPCVVPPVIPLGEHVPPSPPTASPKANVVNIFNWDGAAFENLAVRSNGQILATTAVPEALLFYVDPLSIRPPVLLHNFTSMGGTLGITELAPDRFYLHASGINDNPYTVYSVDMRQFLVLPDGTIFTPPVIKKIGTVPSALLLNGMTHLRSSDNFVLMSDTLMGGVWKFYVDTGKSKMIVQHESMSGPANETGYAAFGINGLRIQRNTLFYCNAGTQKFYKMPLHADGGCAGDATLITSDIACDDFALDNCGFAYVGSPRNALIRLDTRTGAQIVVAGTFANSSSELIGVTSARFGRGDSDQTSVYITTNGGGPVGPPGSQGISRVDVGDVAQLFGRCP